MIFLRYKLNCASNAEDVSSQKVSKSSQKKKKRTNKHTHTKKNNEVMQELVIRFSVGNETLITPLDNNGKNVSLTALLPCRLDICFVDDCILL